MRIVKTFCVYAKFFDMYGPVGLAYRLRKDFPDLVIDWWNFNLKRRHAKTERRDCFVRRRPAKGNHIGVQVRQSRPNFRSRLFVNALSFVYRRGLLVCCFVRPDLHILPCRTLIFIYVYSGTMTLLRSLLISIFLHYENALFATLTGVLRP
jgi:hypothetical protein